MVGFPLLLIPLAVYNIIVFLMPGLSFTEPLVQVTLMSGTEWPVTLSDTLLAVGILLLMLEVIKGARPGAKYVTDHLLSLIVFGAAAAEFVLWPKFGNSTYGLLALLSLADFFSGIALHARRRVAPVAAEAGSGRRAKDREISKDREMMPAEPKFEPAPPPPAAAPVPTAVPPAASVAESVLLDHSRPAQPAAQSSGLEPDGNPSPGPPPR